MRHILSSKTIATVIWICLFLLIGAVCYVSSCGYNTSEARRKCFAGNIGYYQFDLNKTLQNNRDLGYYSKDSDLFNKFWIVFKSDSTFFTNMRVDFLEDTVGRWDAGDCGFEGFGIITYPNSPVESQFGPYDESYKFFTILSAYHKPEGTITLFFRKMK